MRRVLIATLIAAGIGFVGVSAGSAAPVNNTVLKQIANMNDTTTQVGMHNRWRSHYRWGSRGGRHHCGWGSRWCWH